MSLMKVLGAIAIGVVVTIVVGWLERIPEALDKSWKIEIATKEEWGVARDLFSKIETKFNSICETNKIVRFLYRQECIRLEFVPETFRNLVVCDKFDRRFTRPVDALVAFRSKFPACIDVLRHVDQNTIRLQPHSRAAENNLKLRTTKYDTEFYFCHCSPTQIESVLDKVR